MEISMEKLQLGFDALAVGEETLREEEAFLEVIFSSKVSIKELKEKGYTPEFLLQIAARSDEFADNLELMESSVQEISEAVLTAPVVRGARKLF